MSATTMQVNGTDRAAVVRAAQGRSDATRQVPMGIRVITGPGAQAPTTTPAAPEEKPAARTVEELLATAKGSDSARTRTLGEKVAVLLEELGVRVDAEEARRQEKAALEEERRKLAEQEQSLTQQLQQVRQKLRRPAGDATASPRRREGAEQRAAIRAWAAANGHEVKDRGRIPHEVVQAWAAATGSEVTQ